MQRGERAWVVRVGVLLALLVAGGCGGRTDIKVETRDAALDAVTAETCDGFDNDFDSRVDEDFRDELGRYVSNEHCGECGHACNEPIANATEVGCGLTFEAPSCVALQCIDGFGPTVYGTCAPLNAHLCLPCLHDNECGDLTVRSCAVIAGEQRCSLDCETSACPTDYVCDATTLRCKPEGGSCSCAPNASFAVACILTDPDGGQCTGIARCEDGSFSECTLEETCDEQDNDCDGRIDETFRNPRGAYSIDEHNCGMCGVDCDASERDGVELICGGDPLSPSCVLDCPDLHDGLMPGDRVDADRVIANGCECTVTSLDDVAGPVLTEGAALDVNCDGADGDVLNSWYVAADGSDVGPGSPTRPLRTIATAITKAVESLSTAAPRRDIFIASGNYVETLRIPDGVRIHGGYRRDFLSLDPEGFRVVWIAPANTSAPGGAAAVIAAGAGTRETVIEWVALRGVDATQPGAPAIGLWIEAAGAQLFLRDLVVRSGSPGDGVHGASGTAGARPTSEAAVGAVQRAAREDSTHTCIRGSANTVNGGNGGSNTCDGSSVRGGNGGSPGCPDVTNAFDGVQPPGTSGVGSGSASPGLGGDGGNDLEGPISGFGCPGDVCCGLADFNVPPFFRFPQAGGNGGSGNNGTHGNGCTDPVGNFSMRRWSGGTASGGTAGRPGAGGGGGGGGGTARINWFDGLCQFADGLGGGGGGGGAGGCGGTAGRAGTSGGPAIGIVIERSSHNASLINVTIETARGGSGGDGGVGGEGALGGVGAAGGAIARQLQSTPTLAGPGPGARGGRGGDGGAGGGAGGGCGGGSIGVWLLGGANNGFEATLRSNNQFGLGDGGRAGRGGGGAVPAAAGIDGGMTDVLSR